ERKVQERTHELTESQATLNSTVQSLHTIALLMANERFEIVFKNAVANKVLGYEHADWTLQDFARDIHGNVQLLEECANVMRERRVATFTDAKYKDGYFLRIGLNPVFADDA